MNFFSHCFVLPHQCSLRPVLGLSFGWFPIPNRPNSQFAILPRFCTGVIMRPHNSTQEHYLCDMQFVFYAMFWVFSSGRRRYISFSCMRKNQFSSKWIWSRISRYLIGSSGSLKCKAISSLANLFSSVSIV